MIDVRAWGISDFSQIQALLANSSSGATFNAFYGGYNHFITVANVSAASLIASDFIYANPAAKSEGGTQLADVMFGSRYNDALFGYGGKDKVLGGIGNDTLSGGLGADLLNGGVGPDTAVHTTATSGVTADLLTPSANTGEAAGDVYQSIENLGGSNYADSLRGNDLANVLYGYDGNDLLYGRGGNDTCTAATATITSAAAWQRHPRRRRRRRYARRRLQSRLAVWRRRQRSLHLPRNLRLRGRRNPRRDLRPRRLRRRLHRSLADARRDQLYRHAAFSAAGQVRRSSPAPTC